MNRTDEAGRLHPIQVVVRRAGVSADLLRAWEKRYGAVTPSRSPTGRRLYSDADIERLGLMKDAMAGGRRIGDVAVLPVPDLERLIAEDREAKRGAAPEPAVPAPVEDFEAEALTALRRTDQAALRGVLSRALFMLSPEQFIDGVVTPFMHRLGDLWERGELSPGHEHLATEVMRQLLAEVLAKLRPGEGARTVVVATPSGQRHEMGALLAATTAALDGWRVAYIGTDLPGADIGRVALDAGAAAIALSVTREDPSLPAELERLRRTVGSEVPILIGGQRAAGLNGAGRHVEMPADLNAYRAILRSLSAS